MKRPDLSLVVAVRNQLSHNQLFLESLEAHRRIPGELIVVDNSSADGSTELYRRHGAVVISTGGNLCYPESMNLGFQRTTGQFVCFVNNDVYFGAGWDEAMVEAMERHDLDVACPSGMEKMLTPGITEYVFSRWDVLKRAEGTVRDVEHLRQMVRSMYGHWGQFCHEIRRAFYGQLVPGIVGSCVVVRRAIMHSLGGWDPRVQSADWDLYLTVRERVERRRHGRPPMVVGWAYVHHFIRATVKGGRVPFTCRHPRLAVEEKWGRAAVQRMWSDPEQVADRPRLFRAPVAFLRRRAARTLAKGRRAMVLARTRLVGPPGPEELLAFLRAEAAKMASVGAPAAAGRPQ
ncbi:MAG: glycosyltransferase family 2 protein [candidate division NC10 bacterium]|nr:glycosyltransferase family 2 protein [candidate division NC10 bacterium]